MKKFKMNRFLLAGIALLVAAVLFIVGKDHDASNAVLATAPVIAFSETEKASLNDEEKKMVGAMEKLANQLYSKLEKKELSADQVKTVASAIKAELNPETYKEIQDKVKELEETARKHGTSLGEIVEKMQAGTLGSKSIAQTLEENKEELRKVYSNGSGTKQFIVGLNQKGEWVMRPYDPTKAAGPHASIANVGTNGNVASISQSIDAASLLRLGGNSPIVSQFRNNPWVFDLCNLQNASIDSPLAMWYEEQAKVGASATVAEGGTKPVTQYKYDLKTATYKKEATLIGITDEFSIDFSRLESDILGKGRIDVINRINAAILANIISAATAYNTAASFAPGGPDGVPDVNDFDAIAAMAAQVDSATYGGNMANAAIMSTFKKYRMGILKDTQGNYLNKPSVLDGINFVGNPAMEADAVMVGDFKNYNIILRGGFIVKVGYNGTDFAENRFSIVMEQYYFDYISDIRKAAIVKGPDFSTVRNWIEQES